MGQNIDNNNANKIWNVSKEISLNLEKFCDWYIEMVKTTNIDDISRLQIKNITKKILL